MSAAPLVTFCCVCGKREGAVSTTHQNCGGEESRCTCHDLQQFEDYDHFQDNLFDSQQSSSPVAHVQYESSDEYAADEAWLAAADVWEASLPPPPPTPSKDGELAAHQKNMAILEKEFEKVGVKDVFIFVLDEPMQGGRPAKLVTDLLKIHLHSSSKAFIKKKMLPFECKLQKAKYDAGKWGEGCYLKYPPACFAEGDADREAAWTEAHPQLRKQHCTEMIESRMLSERAKAVVSAKQAWVRLWANKLVLASDMVKENHRLLMTPERISCYFAKSSPAGKRGLKRKIIRLDGN
jgi:hypothetical protein